MKANIFKVVMVPVLAISFFASAIYINAKINTPSVTVANASENKKTYTEANQMTNSDMKLKVTGISFTSQPFQDEPEYKGAKIQISFENTNGKDIEFLPKGYITTLVGSTDKAYNLSTDEPIEKSYQKTRNVAKLEAKVKNEVYYPGEFKMSILLKVDADEETFTKVIYQDEKGDKMEIPIDGIKPEVKVPNPDAK